MSLKKAAVWLSAHERTAVWCAIAAYTAVFSAICLWKYSIFAYNGLDLAIYNQTFWNTLHGHFFGQTIHPQSYLGDHAELVLLLLLPLYAVLPDPRTLLVLQVIALALPAWPIYLIAKNRLARLHGDWLRFIPPLLALVWLLNPSVQDMTLDEFHLLPFAVAPLLFAALAYDRGEKRKFMFWTALTLLVREDTALVVAAFGLLAWLEKKDWWWRLVPIFVGGLWFAGIMKLISLFALQGRYKYLVYYSWIGGSSIPAVLLNALLHPLRLLVHLLTAGNLEMVLGFGIPLLFLPYAAPRRLILLLGPLAQILLTAPGGSALVLMTHYAALFLPALFLATLDAWPKIAAIRRRRWSFSLAEQKTGLVILLLLAALYGSTVGGPLVPAIKQIVSGDGRTEARLASAMLKSIPSDAPVAAGYRLLPPLSSRSRVYSLHYIFLGVTQFAVEPYPRPTDIAFTAADDDDFLSYRPQMLDTGWAAPQFSDGRTRISGLAGPIVFAAGPFTLFDDRSAPPRDTRPSLIPLAASPFEGGIRLTGANAELTVEPVSKTLLLSLDSSWNFSDAAALKQAADRDLLTLVVKKFENGDIVKTTSATLDGGIRANRPESTELRRNISLPLVGLPPGIYYPEISLETQESVYTMDGLISDIRAVQTTQILGSRRLPAFRL